MKCVDLGIIHKDITCHIPITTKFFDIGYNPKVIAMIKVLMTVMSIVIALYLVELGIES